MKVPAVLLDTCGLLAWLYQTDDLTPSTQSVIDQAWKSGRLGCCAVTIWEIAWKHRNGKLQLPGTTADFAAQVRGTQLVVHPADHALWWTIATMDWPHRDPADRLIVALAEKLRCPLITNDRTILDRYPDCHW